MNFPDSLRSMYDDAKDYQLELDELAPLSCELKQIDVEYTEKELIATGGMKSIYKVFSSSCQRHVALAELSDHENIENFDPFICEARLTALLEHPNIIKVYEIGINKAGQPFFTMELKNGDTLQKVLNKNQTEDDKETYSLSQLLNAFIKVCDAVAYAHAQGIVHLDLKPDNIQVGLFGEVLVCDWGLGKVVDQEKKHFTTSTFKKDILNNATLTGEVKGTPGYMAPEQITNDNKAPQTDIYALGAILFSILCPKRLQHSNTVSIIKEAQQGTPENLKDFRPHIPQSLFPVIEKAMQKNPHDRYANVLDLRMDVESYLNGYPTEAEQAGLLRQISKFWRRNKTICSTSSAFILLILIGLTYFITQIKASEMQAIKAKDKAEKTAAELSIALKKNKEQSKELVELPKEIIESILDQNHTQLDNNTLLANPVIGIKRSTELLTAALKVYPDSKRIATQLFWNYFISMQFDKAKGFLDKHRELINDPGIEQSFLMFEPGDKSETFQKMVTFCLDKNLLVKAEIILSYYSKYYRNIAEYPDLIFRLYKTYYPKHKDAVFTFENGTLSIDAPEITKLVSQAIFYCIFRYLRVKELKVVRSSISSPREFAGMYLFELDLRGTKITKLSSLGGEEVQIHKVIVRKDQLSAKELKRSSQDFEIEVR
ncbi:serine/threonine-protein kinase [Lentisphaera marina]|uniref:serine/threonine-protein kinase n=1 Tax=Lentisphaera marina TaxID=1111041 RepID=UPI002365B49D|nr:serine/threonine-protein kinase [Lentisphaera marina]MDD7985214.1 serine/threonine-protein kinase [Lentisphaera marina]